MPQLFVCGPSSIWKRAGAIKLLNLAAGKYTSAYTQLTTLIHTPWDKIGIAALGLLKQFYYKGICIRLHRQSQIVPGVCIPNVLLQISVHKASIIWQGQHFCVCYPRGFWRLSAKQSITRITSRLGGWEIICSKIIIKIWLAPIQPVENIEDYHGER